MRLLVVDDDEMLRCIVGEFLMDQGFQVDMASDGLEALNMIQKRKYEFVISDWEMPRMDGPALCRALRREPGGGDIRFILLTGRDSATAESDSYQAGVDTFLHKPCDRSQLMAALREPDTAHPALRHPSADHHPRPFPGLHSAF